MLCSHIQFELEDEKKLADVGAQYFEILLCLMEKRRETQIKGKDDMYIRC